jgi:hypothetical protein
MAQRGSDGKDAFCRWVHIRNKNVFLQHCRAFLLT